MTVQEVLTTVFEQAAANPLLIARIFILCLVTLALYEILTHLFKQIGKNTALAISVLFGILVMVFTPPEIALLISTLWVFLFAFAMLLIPLAGMYGIYKLFPKTIVGITLSILAIIILSWISSTLTETARGVPALLNTIGWITTIIVLGQIALVVLIVLLLGGITKVRGWITPPAPPVTPPAPVPPAVPPRLITDRLQRARDTAQRAAQACQAAADEAQRIANTYPTPPVQSITRIIIRYPLIAQAFADRAGSTTNADEAERHATSAVAVARKAMEDISRLRILAQTIRIPPKKTVDMNALDDAIAKLEADKTLKENFRDALKAILENKTLPRGEQYEQSQALAQRLKEGLHFPPGPDALAEITRLESIIGDVLTHPDQYDETTRTEALKRQQQLTTLKEFYTYKHQMTL